MSASCCALVLAAGRGRRMGADKALLDLGGRTAIARVVSACREGGVSEVIALRRSDAAPLPDAISRAVRTIEVDGEGEMRDTILAGLRARPAAATHALVFPVDYALVDAAVVRALIEEAGRGARIVLPRHDGRVGHPIALHASLEAELMASAAHSLRDVIGADRDRVRVVDVANPWVRRDLDTPEDLEAARRHLASSN